VSTLKNTSDTAFKKVWGQEDIFPDTSDIHELGQGTQLVRLAWKTFSTSNELHHCCHRAHRDLDIDLELNLFGPDAKNIDRGHPPDASEPTNSTKRSEAIAMSTADGALHYVKDVQRPELLVRTRVRWTAWYLNLQNDFPNSESKSDIIAKANAHTWTILCEIMIESLENG
jgi:hypothetical protein